MQFSYTTLYPTRRMYNGLFVPNVDLARASSASSSSSLSDPDDSVSKLVPVTDRNKHDKKATDQVTPLAGRLFGTYTFVAGLLRIYGAYNIENPVAYQLALWGYIVAAVHFTSETAIYKAIRPDGRQAIPLLISYSGLLWMLLQYRHYTSS
ncbi:MAG: hypothetical protein M1819_001632 [Sarea resinae]|nr:MAG: hypothetical protein M1819_001632 [Sarea resinae]